MSDVVLKEETGERGYTRRYVGNRETASYIFYDAANSFGLDGGLFNTDIVKVNLYLTSIINAVNGVWDVINDPLTAYVVDKTRTRWGKFKIYLIIGGFLGIISGLLYWNCPRFLDCTDEYNMGKFWFFLIRALVNETYGTFTNLSIQGFTMSLSPNPKERALLLAKSKVVSSTFDFLPNVIFNALYDLSNKGIINLPLKGYYMYVGSAVTIIQAIMVLNFYIVAKERVTQSVQKPSLRDGLRAVFNNKPVRLYMLSELAGTVGNIKLGYSYYYVYVLGIKSFDTLKDIPTAIYAAVSYAWVGKAKEKIPSNLLWVISSPNLDYVILFINFCFGCIGGKGARGWYRSPIKMWIVMMLMEFPRKTTWGMRNVIPNEIKYEMIDYCEWKLGYRSEGMIMNAIGLVTKLTGNLLGSAQGVLLAKIGFDMKKNYLEQSDDTKFGIFALAYLFPILTGSFSIIPKLMYKITQQEKEQMYAELRENREREGQKANGTD